MKKIKKNYKKKIQKNNKINDKTKTIKTIINR